MMMCCAIGIVQAQTIYVNTPDTVCISTASSTAGQTKYLSVNAMVVTSNRYKVTEQASWAISGPTASAADYEVLYTGNTSAVTKADKLTKTKSLTLQFLVPGTYNLTITLPYTDNGVAKTSVQTRKIVAMDCTISTCGSNEANDKPGFFEDFGTLPGSGIVRRAYPINGVVTYDYQGTGDLADNYYSISNNTQLKGDWVNNTDHTGNSRGGMLVANSAYDPRRFYQKTVTGLCKGSVYNFSAWLININPIGVFESGCVSGYRYAGVTFQVVNAANPSQILANFPTYNVSMDLSAPQGSWQKYGGSFTVPSNIDSVKVLIINNKPGGCGNDIAIDDIEFAYCSPTITASIKGKTDNLAEVVCEGAPITLTSNYTPANYFVNPAYQWEMSDDEGLTWINVPFGTNTSKDLVIGPGQLKGTRTVPTSYRFRVRIYETGSDAVTCASPSEYVRLTILPMPTLYLTKSQVCAGAFVELQASGGFDRFTWRDLPGYVGATRTIQVTGDTTIMVYGYVDYADGHTCVDSNTAFISSIDKPIVDVISTSQNICAGSSVDIRINDALAGQVIEWYQGPDAGGNLTPLHQYDGMTELTQVQINTPAEGVFTVIVRDPGNVCQVQSAPFIVNVTPVPVANAGPDQLACASVNTTGNFTMAALLNSGESGTWTIDTLWGPGADPSITAADFKNYASIMFPNLKGTRVTLKKGGITVRFKWTVKATANTACSSSDFVEVTLLYDPTFSDAGRDTTLCATNVFTMNASQPDGTLTGPYAETGTWKLISGNATIANIHAYNTTVTSNANPQDIVLTWSITNAANCTPSVDTVILHKTARPVISLKPSIITCNTSGTFSLDTLSTSGNPDTYSITAGVPALPGFTAINNQPITAWPVVINYPVGTARGVYNFNLSYKNSLNAGCDSTVPFSVSVETPPVAPTGIAVGSPNICTSGTSTLSVVGGSLGQKADGTPNGTWVWYAGGCGVGAPIGTGTSITVAVSATTTYYVRAETTGACSNTTCASATVTVFQAPNPAAAGPDQTKCNTTAFTMAANAASVGTGTWTLPGGTTATITAGQANSPTAVINVPAGVTVTATWTITNGACTTSDQVVLTNNALPTAAAGPDQTKCNTTAFTMAANTPAVGTGTWSLPGGSTATITAGQQNNPAAVINVPAGVTVTATWTVVNGTCSVSDAVVLKNDALPTAAAGPDQTKCNTPAFTMAANTPAAGQTGTWTLPGGTTATITAGQTNSPTAVINVPAGVTVVATWTVVNGTCSVSDAVTLKNDATPTTPAAGADQTKCNNTSFTLAANAPTVGTGAWSVVSSTPAGFTFPAASVNNPTATITVPVGSTVTLRWTITNGTCSLTDDVVLKNDAPPTTAAAGADQAKCNTPSFTLAANAPTVGTGAWSVVSSTPAGFTFPAASVNNPTAAITVPAGTTVTLRWTITNGTCTSTDDVILTNSALPTTPAAGADQTKCNTPSFTLAANAPTVGTGAWSVVSSTPAGFTFPAASVNNPTATITVPAGTTVTLRWTITNGTCVLTDDVILKNDAAPTTSAAGPDQSKCNTPAFTLAANTPTVGTGAWSVVSSTPAGFTFPAASVNNPTAAITVPAGTTVTLRWTITNGTCTSTDDVTLINYVAPTAANAGADQSKCNTTSFTMAANAASVGTGTWTLPGGTTATITAGQQNSPTAVINVPAGVTVTATWTITNGVCTTSDQVVLTNDALPTAAAGPDQTKCNTTAFTMAANTPAAGQTGTWSLPAGSTATITAGQQNNPAAVINVPAGVTVTATWTVVNGTCSVSDAVVLKNDALPTATAGPDQAKCNTPAFTMAANTPAAGQTGTWTLPGGTTATITAGQANSPTAVINVPAGVTVTATWTVVNGTCSVSDQVTLTNDAPPTTPAAGADQTKCNTPAFTLAANAPTVGTGAWSVVSSSPAGFTFPAASVNNPTAAITVPVGSTVTLRWTITNGTCSLSDDVVLTNDAPPTTAAAGADQEKCNTPAFTLAANAPTVGTGAWSVVSSTPAGFTFPAASVNNPTAAITVPAGTTVTLRWTITNGSCTSTDDVTLINNAQPTTPVAGPDQEKCNTPSFTLAANAPTVGTGAWSVVSSTPAGFTFPAASVNNPTAVITVPAGTTVTLRWTITNGTCSLSDDVILTNDEAPAAANAGPDQQECNNTSTFTLAANAPSVAGATGTWTVVSPASFTFPAAQVNNPTASLSIPAGTVLTLRWTITNGVCTTSDDLVITNYQLPDVANAGPDQAKCAGTDFVTAANTPTVPGAVGTWTVISGAATIAAGEENLAAAHITVANGATAVLRWTIKNGLCENFDEVSLTNFLTPSPANAGPDQRDCNIPTFIMTANAPDVPGATGTWTLAAGSPGTITPGDENKPNAVINVPTGATVTAIWTITNGTCPSVDTVLLTNDEMPSPAAAGPDQEKCNTPAFTMAANVPSVGVGKWSLTAGTTASFAVADSTNPNAVINVPAGVTVTATWTITNGTCVTSDDVILTNYAAPAPAAAGPDKAQCNTPAFTMAANAPTVGTGLWTLPAGSTATITAGQQNSPTAVITVPVGTSVVATWTITNGVCTTSDAVTLTNDALPTATAGPDQAQCNTTAFTMAANTPAAGQTGTWTLPAGTTATITAGQQNNPAAVINVPAGVTVTATWTVVNGSCSVSDAVTLTNDALPTAAAGADQTKCNTPAFTMAANAPAAGQTGTWTLPAGTTATITAGQQNSPTAVINVPAGVSVVATWTVVNGTCSVSDAVTLTNDAPPTTPAAGADQTQCNTPAFTLAANAPTVGTGAWSVVSSTPAGFTFPAASVNNPTAAITVPAGTTVTLRWTITNGTCVLTDDVVLKNDAPPTTAAAGADQTKCNTPSFTLAANAPTVGTGAWSVVSSTPAGFIFPAASVSNPTATITVPAGTTVTLRWTTTNGTCSTTDDVTLVNNALPTTPLAGADQTKCNTPSFTLAANAPVIGTGAWSVVSSSPAGFTFPAASVNNPTAAITVPAGTTVTLRWTITNGTCVLTDDVVLKNDAPPTTSAAGPDQSKCNTPSFTLAANVPTVGTGAWSVVSSSPAGFTLPAASINNAAATITVNAGTTVTLRWTITNGSCTSTDDVTLINYVAPTPAAAGPDQEKCNTPTFTMAAAAPSVGVGKWSLVAGSTASFAVADSSNRNAVINVPAGQSVQAIWTITNGVCTTTDTVRLTNYVAPAPAAAGPDQAQCNTPAFTMAANTPSVGVGKWSLPAGSTASFAVADSTNPNAVINVPAGVTVTATWTIRNGVCTTSDNVTLTNYQQPTAAAAGPDQEQCNTPAFRMAANAPSVGVGKWSLSAGTTASFAVSDSTNPNAAITVPAGVTVTATWTIRNGNCVTSDDVVLTNYVQPANANAGGDMTHCDNDRFVMAANTPSVGTGTWSLPAGTTASIAATDWNNPNAVITVPAGVTVTATWTIKNGTCTTSDNVILTNHQMPANAAAGADQTHCDDPNFTMSANIPSPATATGTWTIVSGTATIADIHSASTKVTVPAGGTVTLRWTITNGTCTSTPDEVVLTNQGAILGNTITADQLLCANQTPATLQGATLSGGNGTFTYQWQVSITNATTGFVNVATNGTNATYTPPMITQNTWYRRVVMSGACTGNISNAVMLTLMNVPPVVISVPGPLTVDCVQGTDYTTKFGTPVFSHAPYNNEPLTVTHNDVTVTVDACTFTIMRTWTATDRCGLTTQAQQTITVVDRTAPVFTGTAPANVTVECDKVPVAVTLTANDACAGALTITPIEVRVDQPGACASNYQLIRKWVAVDACGNASDTLRQVITVRDMTPPVFSNPAPANITVDCDKVPAGQPLTATDNCTPGTITVTPVDVRKNLSGSRCTDNYQIIRTWTATDLCGNKTVLTQTITVQDTIKPRFSMSLPPAITVDCDKVPAVATITATDNCTVSVAVKVSEKKEFLSSVCTSNYRLTRTWTAMDNCGNTATMQQVITVQDTTRPVFTVIPPADTTVSCDAVPAPPTNLKATDNCSAVKISYTQTRETIAGACASNYRLIRIWTAKDQCNNTATIQQVITVTDTTKPVIDPAPANVTLNCGDAIPAAATLYARDNCDATFPKKATMTQDPFTVDLCAGYTITRRWTISDACGNAAIERVQTITVNPCPKPALDPQLPANCSDNTKFAVMLQNKVNRPKFTLVSVVPATAVSTPLTQSSNVFDLNGATQATFIVTDGVTGCVSDPITYDLQYVTKPVVDLGADVAICQGSSITLDAGIANAAYGIRWSTGATTQTIDVTTAGTYTVTVSNGICTTTDAINVTVNMPPVVNIPDTAICEGQSVKLNAYVQGATYVWSTGETTASITVNMTGTYSVDVTLNGCTTHEEATVTVGTPPAITLTDDTEMCPNETLMLTVEPDGGSVRWSTGETTNSIVVTKAGTYEVTVTRDGCVVNDQVTVTERPDLDIDLGPDREFCTGGRVVVDASNPDAISYLWNDGETTPVREIVMPGKYVVSVMDRFCSRITMDSVNVTVAGIPETLLGRDTTLCIGEDLTLKVNAGAGNTIRWQDGSTGSTYKVTGPGIYTVTVSNECGSVSDQIAVSYKPCEAEPHFPTGFTPNGDGHNDIFRPVVRGPMYDYDLRIYNRWGELIFLSKDQKTGWDGRYKGALVENGTYVWMLTYKKVMGGAVNIVKGEVTAIR
ncbi:gliding motility-associated C-terminal domain-containing protein [Chitinophaga filiformis]|uniref:Gliding motility-associated C-terminal domain-containing protein n=2 Tax=Chitinophaga filiformis TaxID=104663 RepID=A0A1G7Z6Q2_CHIFI|nr:gliding motility-associated C-terminal domain-containing protein [Chitinophaga filiformis]